MLYPLSYRGSGWFPVCKHRDLRQSYPAMNLISLLCVFGGAGAGACLRYWLSLALNPLSTTLPLGTWLANLIGGYAIGVLAGVFAARSGLPVELQLLLGTGLLGGLTTFSTFSLEAVLLLQAGRYAAAALLVVAHLAGSLLLTVAGFWTARTILAA